MSTAWHDDENFWKLTWQFQFDETRWKENEKYVNDVVKISGMKKKDDVLDLCCGPGRVIIPLAKRGFRVTGVDLIEPYLKHAAALAKKQKTHCTLIQKDMRTFRKAEAYDVILNLFTSFGYFRKQSDNMRVLKNVFASLKPGGTFMMEIRSREIYERIFRPKDWEKKGPLVLLKERALEKNGRWLKSSWIMIEGAKSKEYDMSHWLYGRDELENMLKSIGFTTIKAFDGVSGKPYGKNASNLVLLAKKPKT